MTRMASRLRILGIVLVLVLPTVLTACGSDEPSDGAASTPEQASAAAERTTSTSAGADLTATMAERDAPTSPGSSPSDSDVAAYCDASGDIDAVIEPPETWGEGARETGRVLNWLEDMTPPDEMREYHNAVIAFYKHTHDFFRSEDENRPYVVEENVTDPVVAELFVAIFDAYGDLDQETRTEFETAGCGFQGG